MITIIAFTVDNALHLTLFVHQHMFWFSLS